jgi:hypothetical protein
MEYQQKNPLKHYALPFLFEKYSEHILRSLLQGYLLRCAKGNEIIKIEKEEIWRKSKSG